MSQKQVYFAALGPLVKIGVSDNPPKRAAELNARLLHTEPGGYDRERAFHDMFAVHRVKGEWFMCAGNLRAYLEDQGADAPPPLQVSDDYLSRVRSDAGSKGGRATWSKHSAEDMGEAITHGQLVRFIEATPKRLPSAERRRMARHLRRSWHAALGRGFEGTLNEWLAARRQAVGR